MSNLKFVVIEGTNRPNRQSIHIANHITKSINDKDGYEATLVDPVEFDFAVDGNDDDSKNPQYTKLTEEADAFILVVPEYNHSFPASLKRILDTELGNYIHKPVGLVGVSAGGWGGVRAVEHTIAPLREMGFTISFADVQVPKVQDSVDSDGNVTDQYVIDGVEAQITELTWLAKSLNWGKENLESKFHQ